MFNWAKMPDEERITPTKPVDPRSKMIKWFTYTHLPDHLQPVSAHFGKLALWMLDNLPSGMEATESMRRLLEAKDAAVRAAIEAQPAAKTPEEAIRS